jgi:hypothetical protein
MLFLSVSLWFTFILVRRLNEYTASIIAVLIEVRYTEAADGTIVDTQAADGVPGAAFDPVQIHDEFKKWLQVRKPPCRPRRWASFILF